ncbi:MAG: histidine phosphatase family protein [Planctomycetaceae bacterium]|jgi:phosphoserine phosphatase|nr:histidine phosphatase family protein [Planctomycetaceae bacterium]
MFSLTLIRPGSTEFDEQHRIQGALDLPLSSEGEHEIDAAIESLQERGIQVIYTSPNEPALSTAQRIGKALSIRVKELEGLSNCNLGLWQGLTIEEIKRKYPKVYKQWKESPDRVKPPQGEDEVDALSRAMKALAKPLKRAIPFGVVVCEPLATFLACSLKQCKHALPNTFCEKERAPLIEQLDLESSDGEYKVIMTGSR